MKIILDFDNTLFNTYQLVEEIRKIFEKAGFTKEEFANIYKETKKKIGHFILAAAIDLAYQLRPFNKGKIRREINALLNRIPCFIYQDFFDFVRSFGKKDIILLSFGNIDWQKLKIEKSKIVPFLGQIIITSDKNKFEELKNILKKYPNEKIFFIDDKARQVDQIKNQLPQIITIKMERTQGRSLLPKSKLADYTIKNLDQVKDIINKLTKTYDKNK